ncbi:MAG: SRPBCC domain-containing protein [Acidobacteriota bacterium]|nr:SRPBCC domain-containing protein [Acidobacteriota bacterium]
MHVTLSGEFTTPRNPDEVCGFLSDPRKFAPLLPDFEDMTVEDATHFTVKLNVGVGGIRGTAEIKMELAEAAPSRRARYLGQGIAAGSQISVSVEFDLEASLDCTRVTWQGESTVSGKLAAMAGGMLEPTARDNIQKLIDALQSALSYPAAQPVAMESTCADSPNPSCAETLQAGLPMAGAEQSYQTASSPVTVESTIPAQDSAAWKSET